MTSIRAPSLPILAVLMISAFAGCVGDAAEENVDVDAGAEVSAGNQTVEANASAEVSLDPPVLEVSVVGDNTTANQTENGTIIETTAGSMIVFDASNSTDPADGNLTVSWDFGDGNATEGQVVNHTFAEAGNYTVNVTATSSASNQTATGSMMIVVELGEIPFEIPDPIVFTGTLTGALEVVEDCADHVFTVGGPLDSFTVAIEHTSAGAIDLDYWVYDPSGAEAFEGYTYNAPVGLSPTEAPFTANAPAEGDWTINVCGYLSVNGAYRFTVTFA